MAGRISKATTEQPAERKRVVAKVANGGAGGKRPTRVEPKPEFVLCWNGGYHVITGKGVTSRILPILSEQPLIEGSNGLRRSRGRNGQPGDWIFNDFRAMLEEGGGKLIPQDVDGPGTSYVTQAEGRDDVYLLEWHRTYPDNAAHGCDVEGYAKWVESLVARGFLPPPTIHALEGMAAVTRDRLDRYQSEAGRVPSQRAQADRMAEHLKIIEAEIAKLEAE